VRRAVTVLLTWALQDLQKEAPGSAWPSASDDEAAGWTEGLLRAACACSSSPGPRLPALAAQARVLLTREAVMGSFPQLLRRDAVIAARDEASSACAAVGTDTGVPAAQLRRWAAAAGAAPPSRADGRSSGDHTGASATLAAALRQSRALKRARRDGPDPHGARARLFGALADACAPATEPSRGASATLVVIGKTEDVDVDLAIGRPTLASVVAPGSVLAGQKR